MCRLRQIVKNIADRRESDHLRQEVLLEWQTKILAQFIAATVDTGKDSNPLLDAAEELTLVDRDKLREKLGIEEEPKKELSIEEIVEKGSPTAADRNTPGSFERLTGGFRSK